MDSKPTAFARWAGIGTNVALERQDLALRTQRLGAVPIFVRSLTSAFILGLGAYLVIQGQLSLGTLVAFQALLASFQGPIADFLGFAGQVQQTRQSLVRLDDVLNEDIDPMCDPARQRQDLDGASPRLDGALTLRGVTFGFKPLAPPLIEDFDLDVEPGQRVAIVGASGSGKSTLVRLIAGLHEPWRGEIRFDGRARREVPARGPRLVDRHGRPDHRPVRRLGPRQPRALGSHRRLRRAGARRRRTPRSTMTSSAVPAPTARESPRVG